MQRIAIAGSAGRLGHALVGAFREAGDEILEVARPQLDITVARDRAQVASWGPDLIINAAAWTDVDGCARDPERARAVNGHAAGGLAEAAARCGARFVQVSTNEVFAGDAEAAYEPGDPIRPRSVYGASKALGEELVAASGASSTIVRTAWLFGPRGPNFATKILDAALRAVSTGTALRVVDDEWGNPTWIPALAHRIRVLVNDPATPPIVHVAGAPPTSRHGWAAAILAAARSRAGIVPISSDAFRRASDPPRRAILALTPANALDWQGVTERYVGAIAVDSSRRSDASLAEDPPSSAPTARSSASDRTAR